MSPSEKKKFDLMKRRHDLMVVQLQKAKEALAYIAASTQGLEKIADDIWEQIERCVKEVKREE